MLEEIGGCKRVIAANWASKLVCHTVDCSDSVWTGLGCTEE